LNKKEYIYLYLEIFKNILKEKNEEEKLIIPNLFFSINRENKLIIRESNIKEIYI
jgi:hypothetical protein